MIRAIKWFAKMRVREIGIPLHLEVQLQLSSNEIMGIQFAAITNVFRTSQYSSVRYTALYLCNCNSARGMRISSRLMILITKYLSQMTAS